HVIQALGVDLPAKVCSLARLTFAVLGPRPTDQRAAVVVDANPVKPGQRATQYAALPQPVADERHGLVNGAPRAQCLHRPQRERHADHRIWTMRLQHLAGDDVAARRVTHESNVAPQVPWPVGWPTAFDIRLHAQDARLVDGDPPLDQVTGVAGEVGGGFSQAGDGVWVGTATPVRP